MTKEHRGMKTHTCAKCGCDSYYVWRASRFNGANILWLMISIIAIVAGAIMTGNDVTFYLGLGIAIVGLLFFMYQALLFFNKTPYLRIQCIECGENYYVMENAEAQAKYLEKCKANNKNPDT